MKCEKCKGDGRMIGGLVDAQGPRDPKTGQATTIQVPSAGWGKCDACKGTGLRSIVVCEPPTLDEVISKGYSPEAAAVIVQQEQDKAGRGERPYGPNDPTSPWGTPQREIIPEAPAPEGQSGTLAAALQKFELGQHVALISGGPVMTVTADLGDEYACEWPILDDNGKPAGKDSRAFAAASLKPIVE